MTRCWWERELFMCGSGANLEGIMGAQEGRDGTTVSKPYL